MLIYSFGWTKEISLISYDSFDPKTTFNPELLNKFFDNKLKIERHLTVIEDYEMKLIYLTFKKWKNLMLL